MERSSEELPSAWTSPLLKEQPSVIKEATASGESSAEKSNTAQISGTILQNPSASTDVVSVFGQMLYNVSFLIRQTAWVVFSQSYYKEISCLA